MGDNGSAASPKPVRVAVIDDYDVVVHGTAAVLRPHGDLVEVVDCTVEGIPSERVDVALLDCFALPGQGSEMVRTIAAHPFVGRVAVFSWSDAPELVDAAFALGADGFLSKALCGRRLAEALVSIHDGEKVRCLGDEARRATSEEDPSVVEERTWPGKEEGLTERESEVLALITQGMSTAQIGESLYLSVNSIKTHTRKLFRKIDVSNRTEAALWGVDHGFRPDRSDRSVWGGTGEA